LRHPGDLEVDPARGCARVAPGRALDLGGIAKGWTADLLVAGMLRRGAAGACANLGGDVAVSGRAPHDGGWYVGVDHQAASAPHGVMAVRSGGVATSTTLRRRWQGPGGDPRHHLLDPRRGTSCRGSLVEVTTIAASAARAEVLTKVAFVAPEHLDLAIGPGEAALLTTAGGATRRYGDLDLLHPVTGVASDAR
jgi:thiamine biosynthesis lipoprotein